MKINDFGLLVKKYWEEIPKHNNFAKLDEFVVMPNHVHGIVIINNYHMVGTDGLNMVGTADLLSLQEKIKTNSKCDRKNMLLSTVIHGFKSSVSRKLGNHIWQRSFHDRIIRSEKELELIRRYIKNNPKNWERDRNNV